MRYFLTVLSLLVIMAGAAYGTKALKRTQVGDACLGITGSMNPVWSFVDQEQTDGTFKMKWGKRKGDEGTSGFCPQRPAFFFLSLHACSSPIATLESCPFYLSSAPILTVFTVTNSNGNAVIDLDGPTILAVGQLSMQCYVIDLQTCGTTGFFETRGSQLCVLYPYAGSPTFICP